MLIVILTALSLSMDAFSLAILYGTNQLKKREKFLLSSLVGLNHFIFPIIGKFIGSKLLSNMFNLNIVTMIVFLIIGLEMIIGNEKDENFKKLNWVEIFIFSISVSIDSFIIGITYQANTEIISSSLIFMLFSSFLTFVGLEFGKKISSKFGTISKKLGGLLIILIGLYSLIA